jgi:tetratricopeptide (TPR) repeat protein
MSPISLTLSARSVFRRVTQGLRRNVADGEVVTSADLGGGGVQLGLADARELAQNGLSSYHAQITAGQAFLYGSAHTVSVITEAECCFRRAFELQPGSVEALTYIAFSLDNQGRWTEAKELYERALAIDPSFALAKERYALALEELNIIDEVDSIRLRRSPFTRFPETVASLGSLDQATV